MVRMSLRDSYYTIVQSSEARYTTQRSRFIGFARSVSDEVAAKELIAAFRKQFYDATHVAWAYAIGIEREPNRMNDDGEPSGTAGRPIYGAIQSVDVSDVLVAVVRYFGGVKLGTSGLIEAYGTTARMALEAASKREIILKKRLLVRFNPELTGIVMNRIRSAGGEIVEQGYEDGCSLLTILLREREVPSLKESVGALYGVSLSVHND